MKMKSLLVLVTCSFFCLITLGQKKKKAFDEEHENFFRIGGKAGVNINKINGSSYNDGFRYNYQLGGFLQFNFNKRFGIQPEVNYLQGSAEFTDDATDLYDDLFRGGSQKNSTLNYLDIPLLLNINLGPSKKVKFQIGPSYAILLQQKTTSLVRDTALYTNGEWAALGGLWIQLPFFNIGCRYRLGLTNINAFDNRQTWKNQAVQIFVGFTF